MHFSSSQFHFITKDKSTIEISTYLRLTHVDGTVRWSSDGSMFCVMFDFGLGWSGNSMPFHLSQQTDRIEIACV